LAYARRLGVERPCAITVERCAPEHVGLGTGTQLGLATALAVASAAGQSEFNPVDLARRLGRGRRSALGLHGFAQGGFLVEGGKRSADAISPLVARADFPPSWSVVLIVPQAQAGLSGPREQEAFARLAELETDARRTDALCRLVLLGVLPALAESDLESFGESLFEFNRRVGEMFAPWQGGVYAHPRTAHLVEVLRNHGVRGVGQSSWGPTVFAVVEADKSQAVRDWLIRRQQVKENEVVVTSGANHAAVLSKG
jgi:beta-RFAP synthase